VTIIVERKFAVEIVYNGVTKSLQVEPEEQVTVLLQKAIAAFGITQQPHLLSLTAVTPTQGSTTASATRKPPQSTILCCLSDWTISSLR
jgi:hypothetical protein